MSIAQTGYTNQQLTKKQYQGGPFSVKLTGGIDLLIWYVFSWTHYLCVFYSQWMKFLMWNEINTKKLSPSTSSPKGK